MHRIYDVIYLVFQKKPCKVRNISIPHALLLTFCYKKVIEDKAVRIIFF